MERLEDETEDLDEFERKEREILQQIEDERQSKPHDDDLEIIGLDNEEEQNYNRPVNELEVIDEEQENGMFLGKETLKTTFLIFIINIIRILTFLLITLNCLKFTIFRIIKGISKRNC